ncbi:MAG: glycoside hydrolase [Chthoniobacterales bacterium]|nr:glycoside hydrolase [Chthoniobacterales bacterium]
MRARLIVCCALLLGSPALAARAPDFSGLLHWRNIGPYRGGRTRAICGVPSQPNVFYMAQVNGGVFKSTDIGRTWEPIFDHESTASVGALAVSVSNPNIIYVGSGEGLHRPDLAVGNGVYKSSDAGHTWTHLGLRDGQQIAQIAVDPRDPDHVLVAVAGHPYGPNEERGIFLSTDGGKHFAKTLYRDENTGGGDVQIDPQNPQIVYASLWEAREGPWENAAWNGTHGGIYKSRDGGKTWQQLSGGLPNDIIQAHLVIAPSAPQTVMAAAATTKVVKLYRSDDAGASWSIMTTDDRPTGRIGGGDLSVIGIDPQNPQVIYSASTVCWKSTDGGKTWEGWRGAPGGDDYQNIWISPNDSKTVFLGSDQGAIITVNGGATWSSWYNQSTAQLYHVSADNSFPYRLYSGQQESGSVGIDSRGPNGEITFRDWHPVAAEEYGYVTADPLDPEIVYGGKLTRYDRRTHEGQEILPKPFRSDDFRVVRTAPIVFSPLDPHLLFFAANTLWKTRDGGDNWQQASPDFTRKTYEIPASVGIFKSQPSAQPRQRGVIYSLAPSPLDPNQIWAGSDDGLIYLTKDGCKNWSNVTPPQIGPWWKVSLIEPGHFDAKTAYAAINTIRLDDLRPHIYRTDDDGKTWQEIVHGLPNDENVNVVREDPQRRGLLYAGTERGVYLSFDDGDNWQSLRLNLPATSVRDLIVKDDDLAIATHGRGFWILDNITALRQLMPNESKTLLFRPQTALRVRWNSNTDTPLPPDEPAGENPPEGAMIEYSLADNLTGAVALEIKDAQGNLIRRYASTDPVPLVDEKLKIPSYWVRPPQVFASQPGLHRFLWDLHGQPLADEKPEYPMTAIEHDTAPQPTAPWVLPGDYSVTLTAGSQSFSKSLTVKMDPRIKTSTNDLTKQFELSKELYEMRETLIPIGKQYEVLVTELGKVKVNGASQNVQNKIESLRRKLEELADPSASRADQPLTFDLLGKVTKLFSDLQQADVAPTAQQVSARANLKQRTASAPAQWKLVLQNVETLNATLAATGAEPLKLPKE